MEYEDIGQSREWENIEYINKGWSDDKKYKIKTRENEELLLKISDIDQFAKKKKEFEIIKDLEEKKILSRCMVLAWLEPKINTEGVIRGKVTPGDYTAKSPANLLDKLMKLRDAVDDEVNRMVNEYSFRGIDINE